MNLLKKHIVLAFTLLSYSINAFGISFDQYEQYDHEKAAIYQTYHFEQLPNFIAEFVTPGIQLNADSYSEGWHINGDLLKKEKMESLFQTTKSYIPYVEQQAPKDDVQAAKLMGTGYAISLGEDSDHQYILSMFHNSKKAINYKKAASYLKKNLLLTDSSQQLLQVLATAHKSITKSLHCETGERIIGGSYRTTDIAVYPNEPSEHKKAKNFFDDFQSKKLGGKAPREADVEITNSDLIMLAKQGIYLAPLPKKISGLMEQFAKDFLFGLQQVKENKITPIAFAAWAHLEIVHIHPFEDGNGRLARLVANTILMAYDYPPMIIGSNEDYTAALNAYTETNDPAYFSRYMVETIAWTAKQLNKPQTGLLEDFETQEEL